MNKKLVTLIQYAFFAALAIFFVWLSLRNLNADKWNELKQSLRQANYWLLIPVLIMVVLSHWVRALRWRLLIQPMGYNPSRINAFLGVMIGYFVNLGAPRLGEVLKCTVLARYEKIPADKLVGTIVAERAFDLVCLLILFAVTFFTQFDIVGAFASQKIYPFFQDKSGHFSINKILFIIGIVVVVLLLLKWILSRFAHVNFIQKFSTIAKGIWHGLTSVKDLKHKWMFLFQTAMIWVLYLSSTWLGFKALDATAHLNIPAAAVVLAMGSIGMIVSPGGIGAYPLLIQQTVSLYGIAEEPHGQAIGWLLWFGQFVIFLIFGVLSFILLPIVNKKKYEQS